MNYSYNYKKITFFVSNIIKKILNIKQFLIRSARVLLIYKKKTWSKNSCHDVPKTFIFRYLDENYTIITKDFENINNVKTELKRRYFSDNNFTHKVIS